MQLSNIRMKSKRKMNITQGHDYTYYITIALLQYFYNFKVKLNQEEYFQHLQLLYGIRDFYLAILVRWFTNVRRCQNLFIDENHTWILWPAVVSKNVSAIHKM